MKSKYDFDKPIHKIDFIMYSPNSLATINNNISNVSISLPREYACNCLQKSFISVDFDVPNQDDTRYADGDWISISNFGSVALFSEAKLTICYGKHSENKYNA